NQYLGPVDGFLRIADPHAVKLPFDVVLDRAREDPRSNGAEAAPADAAESSGGIHDDGPPRLAFRDVHAGYGDRPVLRGINASFRRRETVAVLGPNGSGKTTLFRTAMRLLEPTSGTIEVDGSPIATKTVSQLATVFGYVFQSPSQMLFARTVREELAFGPRNLGRDPATFDTIIDEALGRTALADLEGIRERAPLTLSFGQQKRLALAIALCLQPPTLILDEPSAGQDHRTANGFLAAVSSIPGLESLYLITHDVDLALTHADRILLMRDGELVADGPPTDVIADQEQWIACNLRPTSLLRANAQWGERPGRLLDSETLARRIVARERAAI
ncbi:MAG TPA: ABC transporter ATP-binding protein, partial [Candidatus Limnocylindrales bacterium]